MRANKTNQEEIDRLKEEILNVVSPHFIDPKTQALDNVAADEAAQALIIVTVSVMQSIIEIINGATEKETLIKMIVGKLYADTKKLINESPSFLEELVKDIEK